MKPDIGIALDIIRDWLASLPEPLTHDQFQRLNDLRTWIAQAVQAEREACAQIADDRESSAAIKADHAKGDTKQQRIAQGDMAQAIAAAIRARNGAGRG